MYIDTHAHILKSFFENVEQVIEDCKSAQVEKIVNIGTTIDEDIDTLNTAKLYPHYIHPVIGLHPEISWSESERKINNDISLLEKLAEEHAEILVAIGEIGFDYKDVKEEDLERIKAVQLNLFKKQLEIADRYNLPIVIHCRMAFEDLIKALKEHPKKKYNGVIHSADGDLNDINELINMGFHISFNGIMTFKNAANINLLAKEVNIEHILLETDSPFLAPVPVRGKQNTPANMKYIYDYLANLKGIDIDSIKEQLRKNVEDVFNV